MSEDGTSNDHVLMRASASLFVNGKVSVLLPASVAEDPADPVGPDFLIVKVTLV